MNNLRKYRKSKGFSQRQLAEAIGLNSRAYIAQCENGLSKLSLESAKKIASVLSVDVYDLLGDELLKLTPESKEDKTKALASLVKSDSASFVDAFKSLIDSYMSLLNEDESFEELVYSICYRIRDNLDGFSNLELKNLYVLIVRYINKEDVARKKALKEFDKEIKEGDTL